VRIYKGNPIQQTIKCGLDTEILFLTGVVKCN